MPIPDMPLLWVLRDHLDLTGTKYGCGIAQCGACTVHVDGSRARSCLTPRRRSSAGGAITTIEGVGGKVARGGAGRLAQLDVVQCGYCQSGQIMTAVGAADGEPEAHRRRHRRTRWTATSAAAAPTSASARRSTTPPRRWPERG